MDQKAQSAADRVYQDFDPYFEWATDEGSATVRTLIVMLPGFRRDQLRVQVTSTPVLRINGERQITENRWRRFAKEFSIPPDCDTNEISANFEGGMLYVKIPKLINLAKPQEATNPPEEAPMPQQPTTGSEAPAQEVDQQKSPQKEKEPSDEKEESKTEEAAHKVAQKKVKTEGLSETAEATMPQRPTTEPEAPTQEIDQQKSPQKEKEPVDEKEESKTEEAANKVAQKKVRTEGLSETAEATISKDHGKQGAKTTQRLKTKVLDFTISLRGPTDQNVNQGLGGLITGPKRPKILMNMIVAILLVMVLGMYVKNAFRSSQGGQKFQEF